jgi:hypothetical protein
MRMLALLFSIFFIFNTVQTQPQLFIVSTNIDIGKIYNGDVKTVGIQIKNTGSETLQILNVQTSCGCAAVKQSKSTLQPNETEKIEVSFNSTGYKGKVSKFVTIESNDPSKPSVTVTLHTEVANEIEPADMTVSGWLGNLKIGNELTRTFVFKNITTRAIKIKKITPTHPEIKVKFLPAEISSNELFSFEVSVTPTREGYIQGEVFLETDSKNQSRVPFRILFVGVK